MNFCRKVLVIITIIGIDIYRDQGILENRRTHLESLNIKMGTVPKSKFRGRPLTLDRMDSRSYLVQPEISPISSDSLTVSPSYSFGKDMSYANCYVSMDKSWRNNSFGSDVPLLLHNGNLSPVSMQNIPVCRPVHAGSLTQSNQIYGRSLIRMILAFA